MTLYFKVKPIGMIRRHIRSDISEVTGDRGCDGGCDGGTMSLPCGHRRNRDQALGTQVRLENQPLV